MPDLRPTAASVVIPEPWPMSSPRYLLYKDFESGLCNNWMSLEVGIGLAYLTGRQLVLYGRNGDDGAIHHLKGGEYWRRRARFQELIDYSRHPTILDLLDTLPLPVHSYAEFLARHGGERPESDDSPARLPLCAFSCVPPEQLAGDPARALRLQHFLAGRQPLTDSPHPVWHIHESNLSFYSRFFFDPPPMFHVLMSLIRPAPAYRALALQIAAQLGRFNALHLRLTDFRSFLPQGPDYAQRVAAAVSALFPRDEPLVISTDEPENVEFFAPILAEFPGATFLDQLILSDFGSGFAALPFRDEQTLGFVCNLVLWEARDFAGTPGSTFTGMIHRHRYRRELLAGGTSGATPFRYISSGAPPGHEGESFRDGVFLSSGPGPYSWNRVSIPQHPSRLSWYVEWPECMPAGRT